MSLQIETYLQEIFFNGTTHFARAKNINNTVSYEPLEGIPSTEELTQHLRGQVCWGSYTLLPNSTVRWICWDVDSTDLTRARNIALAISEKLEGIPHCIEFSGNKGYHIWIFLKEPVSAEAAKGFGVRLRESVEAPSTGDPHVEVFPKQERLTPSNPMGNLVKLPLGLHPKTHNRSVFVDCHNGWEAGEAVDPLTVLAARVDFDELNRRLQESTPLERMVALLGGYWTEGERHNLALALAGFLATLGWSKEDTDTLFEHLIDHHGGDLNNILQCVDTTYMRLAEGKTVQGFSALNERLPVAVMRALSELAGQNIADPAIQLIDRIRLEKGPTFLKVRSAGRIILTNLTDAGKFVRTEQDSYWLSHETHLLLNMETTPWQSLIRSRFGVNPKESFGVQVLEDVRLAIWDSAPVSSVHKRFRWDGDSLHINFGGAEVYRLDGEPGHRQQYFNGESPFLFASTDDSMAETMAGRNLLLQDPLDPWKFLTDDLNFAPTQNNAANDHQQRQLLRAWVLSVFFGTLLATRPIALMLGPRGSGKTTSARRILRFFEGFDEDVLGIAEDKPDSLRSSIEDHLILALDNLEKTKVRWLDSFLNRLATGAQIELRQLYKSNSKYTIRPNCFVLGTGIELPSNEEALFSRILPFELTPLTSYNSEYLIQRVLKDNFVSAWRGMFDHLDKVIQQLHAVQATRIPVTSRLADFFTFSHRIRGADCIDGDALLAGLDKLIVAQNRTMGTSSAAVAALELWLDRCSRVRLVSNPDDDPEVWRTAGQLFPLLQRVAQQNNLSGFRWESPNGFNRHFTLVAQGGLPMAFETQTVHNTQQGREERQYRFPVERASE